MASTDQPAGFDKSDSSRVSHRGSRWRRTAWLLPAVAILAAMAIWFAPVIVARTPLRNVLLNRAVAAEEVEGQIDAAQLGWNKPLLLEGLYLRRQDDKFRIKIERVALRHTGWSLLQQWPELGHTVIQGPTVDVVLAREDEVEPSPEPPRKPAYWTTSADVHDASLMVRASASGPPLIKFENVDFKARVSRIELDRMLQIEPVTIFQNQELTPELFDHGLQLIAPVLAKSTRMQGKGDLELSHFLFPMDAIDDEQLAQQVQVRGRLAVRGVEASLDDPAVEQVAARLSGLLGIKLPDKMQLVDSEVGFEVREGRVYHDGLTFFIPDLSQDLEWRTSGSVGFDESLDLLVEAHLPLTLLGDTPLLRDLSARPVRFHVEGTLDDPQLRIPQEGNWLKEWSRALLSRGLPEDRRDVGTNIMDMVDGFLDENPQALDVAPLIEAFRERRAARADREAEAEAGESEDGEAGDESARRRDPILRRFFRRSSEQ